MAVRSATKTSHILLAAIPLIFAAHQFAEGVHWLALTGQAPAAWGPPAMYAFLTFGEIVWPFWVPLSVLMMETDERRRRYLKALLALGVATAAVRAFGLWAWPVSASIANHHIQYRLDHPAIVRMPSDIAYAILAVVPLVIARAPVVRVLGVTVLASLIISKILFFQTFISVWCFFAALISALVVVAVRRVARNAALSPVPVIAR